jgi:hypothetical protein
MKLLQTFLASLLFLLSFAVLAADFSLPKNQWRIISLPANPPETANTVDKVFGDDISGDYGADWALFEYDTGNNQYKQLTESDVVKQGKGYWIIQSKKNNATLRMPAGSTNLSNLSINLASSSNHEAQWNLVGFPYSKPKVLGDFKVKGSDICTNLCDLNESQQEQLVHNKVWTYNGSSYDKKGVEDNLNVWEGFWIPTLSKANGHNLSLITNTNTNNLPLIYANNLKHLGSFKVPSGEEFSYGGSVITYNQASDSLFIVGHAHHQKVAEISIPEPIKSTDVNQLNRATLLQAPIDITEGNRKKIAEGGTNVFGTNDVNIGGLLVHGGKLVGTSYAYYSDKAVLSHFTSGLTLSTAGDFSGMHAVGSSEAPTASFVSGWMTNVPADLQSKLGGPVLTGNGSLSILSRTSFGPAAFSFDPAALGVESNIPATPLLYYPEEHQTLNKFVNDAPHPVWNGTTTMAGMTMINGTRSILYFGYHGIGQHHYGAPSDKLIFADTCRAPDSCVTGPKGWPVCEDPMNCTTGRKGLPFDSQCNVAAGYDGCFYDPTGMEAEGKGPHAYPYVYQVWAYDADELASVKDGLKKPWDVQPYAVWQLPFPVTSIGVFGGAAAYDAVSGRLFVAAPKAETNGCCEKLPMIHVFQVNLNATPASSYKIGGKVVLLDGSVTLNNNSNDKLTISSADRRTMQEFSFDIPVDSGGSYDVSIAAQPEEGSCTVYHGSGTVNAGADIKNILIYCDK